MHKLSKYNRFIKTENCTFIYNSLSGGFCELPNQIYKKLSLVNSYFEKKDFGADTEFEELYDGGMIIDSNDEEDVKLHAIHNLSRFSNSNSLTLTIAPTLGCNCRCTYCFEQDNEYPNEFMNEATINRIVSYVKDNLRKDGSLSVCWFGGEPLLKIDLIQQFYNLLSPFISDNNISIYSSIITNGVLLTEKNLKILKTCDVRSIQITLDGFRDTHDQLRPLVNGKGTYLSIIQNLENITNDFDVAIRINITKENYKNIDKLFDDMISRQLNNCDYIQFYFAHVRNPDIQENADKYFSVKEYAEIEVELYKLAINKNINIGLDIRCMFNSCGALSPYSMTIEPNGSIQRCYNNLGIKNESVGNILYEKQTSNEELNNNLWMGWSYLQFKECLDCEVLPLCMAGCPYYSISKKNKSEYIKSDYRCSPLKYNLDEILKILVLKSQKGVPDAMDTKARGTN